jgi:hypothetical protein
MDIYRTRAANFGVLTVVEAGSNSGLHCVWSLQDSVKLQIFDTALGIGALRLRVLR